MKKHSSLWAATHKWLGLLMAVLALVFCLSGVVLNHRTMFSSCDVSRSLLPADYHVSNYNNGMVKGTLPLADGRILAYGGAGVWLTDSVFSDFKDFNAGLPKGADNCNIRNIVCTREGDLWCATQFGIFRHDGSRWEEVPLTDCHERITDVALTADSASVVALTRSAVYPAASERVEMKAPAGYEPKVSLFKTMWMLHSGELFGLTGRLVVDAVALILIFLSVTGIILFILPYSIRRSAKERVLAKARAFKWNFRWHNKVGFVTAILTIIIAFTGMCLRPPLMVPFVLTSTAPLPGSALDSDNAWHDKLRAIRWDAESGKWLISTSEGFYRVDQDFEGTPEFVKDAPHVSPMGVTVFEPTTHREWLIGSFSGLYRWNPSEGTTTDYFTGEPVEAAKRGRPTSEHLVAGYSKDLVNGETVFDYAAGANAPLPASPQIERQPMSAWNVALELHVGRCYTPFLGPVSVLFVFLSGSLLLLVLISGLILHFRYKKS